MHVEFLISSGAFLLPSFILSEIPDTIKTFVFLAFRRFVCF